MKFKIESNVPIETLTQLARLSRDDLPKCIAIEQAREMYPWVDQLFDELCHEAGVLLDKYHGRVLFHSLFHDNVDEIFERAATDVFSDTPKK